MADAIDLTNQSQDNVSVVSIDEIKKVLNKSSDDSRIKFAITQSESLLRGLYPIGELDDATFKNLVLWYTIYLYKSLSDGDVKSEKIGDVSVTYKEDNRSFYLNQIKLYDRGRKLIETIEKVSKIPFMALRSYKQQEEEG